MKSLHRCVLALFSVIAAANASASSATRYEGIWADDWLGGYGTWLPLIFAVTVYLIIWLARKHRK